ncbi:tyrosine phosphatase family protein [Pararhizobium mangrovi]|uniref:Protein tyrosine phosphatase n=1 Tax=Pararhizobium mangrovi TaxID=2590452 RepID=A0A506UEE4_9HYPH|nr:tyrosine phosphatase family protein [Pararhizobium mangrovi]TPW32008.1 protein tyrosine phosphatase [Pararhizobium mangrovi]
MPTLLVAPLSRIAETSIDHGACEMISLLGAGHAFHRPASIARDRHLSVDFNDIAEDMPGFVAPQTEHVRRILAFAETWDQRAPLLIHCWMGISRSPAAAILIALALAPEDDEVRLAQALRAASPSATPNPRLIALGDALLGRGGRLERAVRDIGRGSDAMEGEPFALTFGVSEKIQA